MKLDKLLRKNFVNKTILTEIEIWEIEIDNKDLIIEEIKTLSNR